MPSKKMQIALLGYCCDTGIGIANADFYRHLPFFRWLVVPHEKYGVRTDRLDSNCIVLPLSPVDGRLIPNLDFMRQHLEGVTTIFSIERGYYPGLFRLAHALGIKTILMPNAEWFAPDDPDMATVDTFIAPTYACLQMLIENGFESRARYLPHPIDVERFQFVQRSRAEVMLHCRGWGGFKERKGTDIFLEAARRCSDMSFILRYQQPVLDVPSNVRIFSATDFPEQQYIGADICIQPSRWEGVGLQILEAMACGLPTIVPDAPPMNEYPVEKKFCIPSIPYSIVIGRKRWIRWEMNAELLAQALQTIHRQPIGEASLRARQAMELRLW